MPDLSAPTPTVRTAPVRTAPARTEPGSTDLPAAGAGRTVARWMLTFTGFPLGGLLTDLVVGPVDGPGSAVLGGLLTGAVLGAVQVWGLGRHRPEPIRWILATATGLAVGLVAGTTTVEHGTGLADLVVLGAFSGAGVGALQALVLRPVLGRRVLAWPFVLAAIWAIGWAVTMAAGVQVEEQFSVFGASGAVVVTAFTASLPVLLARRAAPARQAHQTRQGSAS